MTPSWNVCSIKWNVSYFKLVQFKYKPPQNIDFVNGSQVLRVPMFKISARIVNLNCYMYGQINILHRMDGP